MRHRRRTRWHVAPALLAIGCVSGASVVSQSERAPAAPIDHPTTPVATPVLSARRIPEIIAAPVADRRLTGRLIDLMAQAPAASCLTVAIDGQVVFGANPALSLVPASIEKLMTAQAILDTLGASTVLSTSVRATAAPANGVLDGDLWLVGGGDPLLMTDPYVRHFKHQPVVHSDLGVLADRIVGAGITRITGRVVGDDSRYDQQRFLPQWPARFQASAETGPLSALTVNDALVEYPPNPDVKVPAPRGADDPAVHAADQLTQLLAARGVEVEGAPDRGRAPDGAREIAHLESPPIGDMLAAMLTESDNGTAELLTKELGVHDSGAGTTVAGVAAITRTLQAMGLPLDGTAQVDGSGLASENRETCTAIQAMLDRQGAASELAAGLPVAGQTGTLDERFVGTPIAGRMRAKTGTLNQATALAGYVQSTQGTKMSFAFMMNVPPPRVVTLDEIGLEEQLASILVAYPESVDLTAIGPKP